MKIKQLKLNGVAFYPKVGVDSIVDAAGTKSAVDTVVTENSINLITSGAVYNSVPTKTSDLTNDSNFVNQSQFEEAVSAAKSEIKGNATLACDTLGKAEALITAEVSARVNAVSTEVTRAQAAETAILNLYQSLSQSAIEVVDTLPPTGNANNIYRLVGTTSYSDYMYNTDDLNTPILMATYNNAIENEPTPGSNNLVKSGGVAAAIVFDISAYHATGSTLATYADLAAALGYDGANVPASVRKGGMSVKFVQSSDNKYVQYRLMSSNFNTTLANWQGVDDVPTAGSDNLVKSGGAADKISELEEDISQLAQKLSDIKFNADKNGYINPDGELINGSTNGHHTGYIEVKEGESYIYQGKYAPSALKAVWGYTGNQGENPIALVDFTGNLQKTEFIIPNGINYICAWSQPDVESYVSVNTIYTNIIQMKDDLVKISEKTDENSDRISVLDSHKYESTYLGYLDVGGVYHYNTTSGTKVSGFIPVKKGDVIRYNGQYSKGAYRPLYAYSSASESSTISAIGEEFTGEYQEFTFVIDDDTIKFVRCFGLTESEPTITILGVEELAKLNLHSVYDAIVDINGKGDFLSLDEALKNLKDTDIHKTIYLRSGVYKMPSHIGYDYSSFAFRNLSIIGEDKNTCIIRNDYGLYGSINADGFSKIDSAPLRMSGNVLLKNLTIISTDDELEDVYKTKYKDFDQSYCVHIDMDAHDGDIFEIDNCKMYNNHSACLGVGLRKGLTLIVRNSEFYTDWKLEDNGTWAGAILVHDGEIAGSPQKLFVDNNIIEGTSKKALCVNPYWNNNIDVQITRNLLFASTSNPVYLESGTTTLSPKSGMNNVDIAG